MTELFNTGTSLLASSLVDAQRKLASSLNAVALANKACELTITELKKSYESDLVNLAKAASEANAEALSLKVKLDSETLKSSILEAEIASINKERELDSIALNEQAATIARLSKELELIKLLNSSKSAMVVKTQDFNQLKTELEEMTKERNSLISIISAFSERVRVGSFKFPLSHKLEILNDFFRSVRN